jgi:hypothetical protein
MNSAAIWPLFYKEDTWCPVKFTKTKNLLILIEITALIMVFPIATSAQAANSGSTGLTFVINPYVGGLAIAVPSLGAFAAIDTPETSTSVTLMLETVTVTDTRRSLGGLGSWTAFAQSTNLFSQTDTLTANTFGYASGIHAQSGGAVTVTAQSRSSLDQPVGIEWGLSITGNDVVSWRPSLIVPVPALKTPGSYSGIITHSVS